MNNNKIMLSWREAEEKVMQALNMIKDVKAKMQVIKANKSGLDQGEQLLVLNSQKYSLEWAKQIEIQLKAIRGEVKETSRLLTSVGEMRETTQNYCDYMRTYRREKTSFKTLLNRLVENKQIDQEQLDQVLKDREKFRQVIVDAPLFDTGVAREFAILEAIFRIVCFYSFGTEEEYESTKQTVNRLISRWGAEDELGEDQSCSRLLTLFLLKNVDRFSILGKRDPGTVTNIIVADPITKRKKRISEDQSSKTVQYFMPRSTVGSKPTLVNNYNSSGQPRENIIVIKPVVSIDAQSNGIQFRSSQVTQPNCGVLPTTSGLDQLRHEMRELLFNALHEEFKEKLAQFYSRKLEGEIFSHYYTNIEQYREKTISCVQNLSKAIRQDVGNTENLMTTALDFEMISAHSRRHPERNQLARSLRAVKGKVYQPHPIQTNLEKTIDAEGLSPVRGAEVFEPTPKADRKALELALYSNQDDSESFNLLENITKIREEEIRKLKADLFNIQKENEILRNALLHIRTNLLQIEEAQGLPKYQIEPNT